MGRTFTGARTDYFIIALNMWFVSWESTPARVKASNARRLLSIHTQNMMCCITITDTPSIGAVVPPDWFGGIALGSSLYSTEGY
jgi:hypothetical protein